MATGQGVFFSLEAHGTIGNTVTAKVSRGQRVITIKPTPTQRYTESQAEAKSVIQTVGEVSRRVFRDQAGMSDASGAETPLVFLRGLVVAPEIWSNVWTRFEFPNGRTSMAAELVLWDALTDPEKATWTTLNDALTVPFDDIVPEQGGTRTIDANTVAFLYVRGLAKAGYLSTIPLAAAPTWQNVLTPLKKLAGFKAPVFPKAPGKPGQSNSAQKGVRK